MNKIILDKKELILENTDIIVNEINNNDIFLQVYGTVKCGILSLPQSSKITIFLHENSQFILDFLVMLENTTSEIIVYNKENSQLDLQYACRYSGENKITINNHIENNNTKTNIFIRTVEDSGTLDIKAEGCICEHTKNNIYLEDIKAITNQNNHIRIMPNLLVKTNSVIANHNATISNIKEEDLFYLAGKGIGDETAKSLIKSGFLKSILKIDELKMGGEE